MAAGVLLRAPAGAGLVVESAGLSALVGEGADPLAMGLLLERGVDISAHRARQLTLAIASAFDLILVMDDRQQRAVESLYPSARGRAHRLGRFGDFNIADPYGKPRAAFESSLALIERGIDDFVRAFWTPK